MWKSNGEKFIFYDKKDGIFKFSFVPPPFAGRRSNPKKDGLAAPFGLAMICKDP